MRFSEQVDRLLPALAAIQNRVEVKKNAVNPHHKNKYANIEAIIDACSPELEKQGLMFMQTLDDEGIEPGQVLIITRIIHIETNQWVESRLKITAKAATPQDLGGAVTYARRYSLVTILGLTPEDDDANAAQGLNQRQSQSQQRQQQQSSKPKEPTSEELAKNNAKVVGNKIIEFQKQHGLSNEEVLFVGGINSIKELVLSGQYQSLLDAFGNLKKKYGSDGVPA